MLRKIGTKKTQNRKFLWKFGTKISELHFFNEICCSHESRSAKDFEAKHGNLKLNHQIKGLPTALSNSNAGTKFFFRTFFCCFELKNGIFHRIFRIEGWSKIYRPKITSFDSIYRFAQELPDNIINQGLILAVLNENVYNKMRNRRITILGVPVMSKKNRKF